LSQKNASHAHEIEGQADRIAEQESQKPLDLEQKAQNEQIESEHAPRTREFKGLRTQADIVRRSGEVRNNNIREWMQRFEQRENKRSETKARFLAVH